MKKFKYVAVNLNQKRFTGTFLAEDEQELAELLSKQNLFLISSKVTSDVIKPSFFSMSSKIKMVELTTFCRQFAIMSTSGMSILQILDVLKNQSFNSFFRAILTQIYEDVKGGSMLSDAISKHKKAFPNFFRSMIKVGEISGKFDEVMNALADYYDNDQQLRRKAKSALAYPIFLLVLIFGILALMMLYVVPTFNKTLDQLEVERPLLTEIVTNMSIFLQSNIMVILLILVGIIFGIILFGRTTVGRYFYDTLAISLPLFRKVTIAKITARFARSFSLLLSSGMDVFEALQEVSVILGNKNVERRFNLAVEDVRQGMSLTMAFQSYKLFPEILIQMVAIGERTASLDEVLSRSCTYFDNQADSAIRAFTGAIQPIMILIIGVIVGTCFISIYSPILSIMNNMNY